MTLVVLHRTQVQGPEFELYTDEGPDVLNKMYNHIWLEEKEVHLHRLLWRDTEDAEIEDFTITSVNI